MLQLALNPVCAEALLNPVVLRDQLRAGDPAEITALATAFAQAANDEQLAAELAQQQVQLTMAGYASNTTPVDYAAEAQATSAESGTDSQSLRSIAVILDSIADELAAHIAQATALVDQLRSDIDALARSYQSRAASGTWPPDELVELATSLHTSAVGLASSCGQSVQSLVADYQATLTSAQYTLADLGYVAPDALDEGPGDVGVPDPTQVAAQTASIVTDDGGNDADVAVLTASTAYLYLLERKIAAGTGLTSTEAQWMATYFDQLVPHFPQLEQWADAATCTPPGGTPNPDDPVMQLVTRIGNGVLLLSAVVPYVQLPSSLRTLLDGGVGVESASVGNGPRATIFGPPSEDPQLSRYAQTIGFIANYSTAGTAPSAELAEHLKDAALRWKQETNAMWVNYQADQEKAFVPPVSAAEWIAMFPDTASSDALTLVARNAAYTNEWIATDDVGRRTVMGLNWTDARGAAAVLLAAALPSDAVPPAAAALAAKAIITDAATGYSAFAEASSSAVDAAVTGIGIAWIDSFAVGEASTAPDLGLSDETRVGFVKYVVSADPQLYGAFRQAALDRSIAYTAAAMAQGGGLAGPTVTAALDAGARLVGAIDGAAAAVCLDEAQAQANPQVAEQLRVELAKAAGPTGSDAASTIVNSLLNAVQVLPTSLVVQAVIGAAMPITGATIGTLLDPPVNQSKVNQDVLAVLEATTSTSSAARKTAQAAVLVDKTVSSIVVAAGAQSGTPLTDAWGNPLPAPTSADAQTQLADRLEDVLQNSVVDAGQDGIDLALAADNDPDGRWAADAETIALGDTEADDSWDHQGGPLSPPKGS